MIFVTHEIRLHFCIFLAHEDTGLAGCWMQVLPSPWHALGPEFCADVQYLWHISPGEFLSWVQENGPEIILKGS